MGIIPLCKGGYIRLSYIGFTLFLLMLRNSKILKNKQMNVKDICF